MVIRWRGFFVLRGNIEKAVYLNAIHKEPMDEDIGQMTWMVQMCEKFGWTFEHVRNMPFEDVMIIMGYMSGVSKVEQMRAMKQSRKK